MEEKIKITLTQKSDTEVLGFVETKELKKIGVEICTNGTIAHNSPESKQCFENIIKCFGEQCGKKISNAQDITIKVYANENGIVLQGITESFSDDDIGNNDQEEVEDETICTFCFSNFDNLVAFCKQIETRVFNSALYRIKDYHLVCMTDVDTTPQLIALASEFNGKKVKSLYTYAEEHGAIIITNNAVETLTNNYRNGDFL